MVAIQTDVMSGIDANSEDIELSIMGQDNCRRETSFVGTTCFAVSLLVALRIVSPVRWRNSTES
jgi:hypothetical protein